MNGFQFNSLTQFLLRWSGSSLVILILVLVIALPVAVFFLMRRTTVRAEPALWQALKAPVAIALLPMLACGHFWGRAFLAMGGSLLTGLFETGCVVLVSGALYGAILRYKGLLSRKRLSNFMVLNFAASITCIAFIVLFIKGYELLLFTDSAFRDYVAAAEKILQERAQNNLPI